MMLSFGDRLSRLALFVVPVTTFAYGFSLIPHDVLVRATSIMVAWLTLSLPVGVLAGHLVLEEADGRYSQF